METVKKIIRRPAEASNIEMLSLLKDIKNELVIDRKSKLKNSLILATARFVHREVRFEHAPIYTKFVDSLTYNTRGCPSTWNPPP